MLIDGYVLFICYWVFIFMLMFDCFFFFLFVQVDENVFDRNNKNFNMCIIIF